MEISRAANQARRDYHFRWRQKNKERIRQYNAKYWEKVALQEKREKQ